MPELASLTIDHAPNKTTYFVGDRFERYGMVVKAHYDDGTSNTIVFYMCSPINPLTINDTQITVSFMDKSVTQSITVINPPSTGYFINKCLDKANYGNNPYVNTVDGSISFYNSPITIERDSYQLNVIISYHSRMSDKESDLIKGFYKGFRTNYHQFLIKDGKDSDNNDIYKYIDGNGYIHTFLYNEETNLYHDKEGRYLILNITNRTITDAKDNVYTFDTSGRLISIQSGLNPLDIKVIEYNSDGLRKIYDNRNPNVYIKFSYNFSFLLYIRAYYNDDDNPLKTYTFNGLFGQITSISESVGNNTRTLYEYLYNDREKVRRIVDHLNHTAYRLTYDFDTILNDYRFNSIRQGYMSNDSLIEQKGIYFVRRNTLTTDAYKSLVELVIRDDNNIDTSFMSDINGEPVSVLESQHGYTNTYKTLSKEIGMRLSFQGTGGTINGKKAKSFSSLLTINEGLASADLDSSEHVKLCGYIKIMSSVQRAKLLMDSSTIFSDEIDINPNASYVWQYFEVPFRRIIHNGSPHAFVSFTLEVFDQNDEYFEASICNLRFVKCEAKQRLFFLNNNEPVVFDNITSIKLEQENGAYQSLYLTTDVEYLTEIDLINTLKRFYSHNDEPSLLYLNNGKIIRAFYGDFYAPISSSTPLYFLEDDVSNDYLGQSNNWFFATSLDAKTKTYYRFKTDYYEIIVRNEITDNNNQIKFVDDISKYNYQDQLLENRKTHFDDSFNASITTTSYEYFADGELKKKYVEYTDVNNTNRTSVLYEAALDSDEKYIERKTQEYQSYDYDCTQYLITKKTINTYHNNNYSNSSSSINYSQNGFLDGLNKIEFKDDSYVRGEHNSSLSNNNQTISIDDTITFYRIVSDIGNQTTTIRIYNGSNYVDIVSTTKTGQSKQVTYNTSFNNSSSSQTYLEEYNVYHQITSQKVDGDTVVTYVYEDNVLESQSSARLASVIDDFIDKTSMFYYNDETGKLIKAQMGDYYCEYHNLAEYSETTINYSNQEQYKVRNNESMIATVVGNEIIKSSFVQYTFDSLSRVYKKTRMFAAHYFDETFAYSPLFPSYVESYNYGNVYTENYQYDLTGNLSRITTAYNNSTSVASYTYDYFGRIMSEYNAALNINRSYSYDNTGRMIYFGGSPMSYDDRGRLVSFGNNTYQYDEYGNRRIKNLNINFQYTRGNLLLMAGFNSFKYDYLGRRYSKNGSDGIIHTYYYEGSKLVGEDRSDGIKLRFFYDKIGLCGFRYIASNSQFADCYYVRNAFNDIVGIANGTTILVRYIYDAWGNHQIIDNTNINLGAINPFRYKSYYFDSETNLYYLNSRYYDPEIGQFISPDKSLLQDFESLGGINFYLYKDNKSSSLYHFGEINAVRNTNYRFSRHSSFGDALSSIFGAEYRESAGFEDSPDMIIDTQMFRIGISNYTTYTKGNHNFVYAYAGQTIDAKNMAGVVYYAGIGIDLFGIIGGEAQYETFGVAASAHFWRLSFTLEINLSGMSGITVGVTDDIGNNLSNTRAFTIGVNTGAIVAVAVIVYCILTGKPIPDAIHQNI